FLDHFPFLAAQGLRGGFTYGDAQTDDARLVLELVAGALAHGAVCVNYARLDAWSEAEGKVWGATVRDEVSGATVSVTARQCVNTSGQWLAMSEAGRNWCRLSKGVHLVLPALPTHEAILLTAKSDGRVFFIIPWYGRTLLGTTDTDYHGDVNRVEVDDRDMDYLLAAANDYLQLKWTRQDVIAGYAGLRVMKQSDAAHPSAASRDWEIKTAANGLHHSVGGKLTSAREDASVIVDMVCAQLGRMAACASGVCDMAWKPQPDFTVWSAEMTAHARMLDIDGESARWLLCRHGARVAQVLRLVEQTPQLAVRIVPELPLIEADLLFCAQDEMVLHLSDLLRRRLPLLILAPLAIGEIRRMAECVAPVLGWDAVRIEQEVATCRA
ncbi:MAG: FAD-dependent oxidoreductase, partial [Sideroxydans sp.]